MQSIGRNVRRVKVNILSWYECPRCGIEVRGKKPKLCRSCMESQRQRRRRREKA